MDANALDVLPDSPTWGTVLKGNSPLTGMVHHFVLGEPSPGRQNILVYHPGKDCFYYSTDACKTIERVMGSVDLREVDVMI